MSDLPVFDWTNFTVVPTASGKIMIKWFQAEDRPQSKTFEKMEDLLDFLEMNF
jgi:hypothetical protein